MPVVAGMRWIVSCLLVLAMSVSSLPAAPAMQTASADFCGPALERYVLAPESRSIYPKAIGRVDLNGGIVSEPAGLLAPGGNPTVIERLPTSDPAIVLDFGRNISGQVTVVTGTSSSPELRLAASESLAFLTRDSDVVWGDQRTYAWHPSEAGGDYRSGQLTFRYLMLYLAEAGRVEIDHVVAEYSAFHGTPETYAGCFETSDDELNRIWHAGAYTLEMNTVAQPDGSTLLLDGAKRDRAVWVGDLAVAARVEYATHNRPVAIRDSLAAMADLQRPDGTIPPSSFLDYSLIL